MKKVLVVVIMLLSIPTFAQQIIKGTIKTSDGSPAEFVNIGLLGTNKGTTVNSKGEYEIRNVEPGIYTLKASFVGLETKEQQVTVKANEITTVAEIILNENSQTLKYVVVQASKNYTKEPTNAINRMDIKSIENPQSIQVINQELIKDKQIQSVGEAVKLMAGVNSFSSSQYGDYTMRGFRTSPGNFAYNGVRGDFYQFDQAALTYNIESIEAIKGPASVLFSAGNPGGVINHVTKKPTAAPRYELQYTFGSFNQHRLMADATGAITKNNKLLYRMIVGYENTGQLDKNLKIKNVFVAPQLQYNFNEKTSLNYEFNFANDNRTMGFQRGVPALFNPSNNNWTLDRYPNNASLIDPEGTAIRNTISNQLTFKHSFNDKVKWTTIYRGITSNTFQSDLTPRAWGIGATNDSIPLLNRSWIEDVYNHQLSSYLNINLGKDKFIKNNIVIGIDGNIGGRTYEYADFEERMVAILNPQFGWGVYTENGVKNSYATSTYQSGAKDRTILLAGYVQDQIKFGKHFSVLLGGRLETHNYSVTYSDLVTKQESGRDSLTATQFLPRAGVVYNPTESSAIYYSYSQGFQPQWGSNSGAAGGPFPPEKSRQHEIGVKKEWLDQRLTTTIAFYHIQKYDVLAPDPTDTNGVRLKQISNVYSKGVEFTAQGKITRGLDVVFNYSYNEATTPGDYGYDGFPSGWFPQAPNTNINLWAKYTVTKGKLKNLGAGAGFNYLSKRSTYTPGFELPEFTTVDAAMNYKIKRMNVSANIYNITNTKFWNGAYGPSNLWPGNPRSFRLTVGYVF